MYSFGLFSSTQKNKSKKFKEKIRVNEVKVGYVMMLSTQFSLFTLAERVIISNAKCQKAKFGIKDGPLQREKV